MTPQLAWRLRRAARIEPGRCSAGDLCADVIEHGPEELRDRLAENHLISECGLERRKIAATFVIRSNPMAPDAEERRDVDLSERRPAALTAKRLCNFARHVGLAYAVHTNRLDPKTWEISHMRMDGV